MWKINNLILSLRKSNQMACQCYDENDQVMNIILYLPNILRDALDLDEGKPFPEIFSDKTLEDFLDVLETFYLTEFLCYFTKMQQKLPIHTKQYCIGHPTYHTCIMCYIAALCVTAACGHFKRKPSDANTFL